MHVGMIKGGGRNGIRKQRRKPRPHGCFIPSEQIPTEIEEPTIREVFFVSVT
jgi:hypothetical protein